MTPRDWPLIRFRLTVERLTRADRLAEARALIAACEAGTEWKEGPA